MSTRRRTKKTIASYYEESDSDFVEEVKRPNKRRKVKKDVEDTSFRADGDNELGAGVAASHPASLHILGDTKPLRTALLNWYADVHEKRGMPWRKRFDASLDAKGQSQRAYEVWISEIMLQQTQVATVIPYYNRWIAKFPSIEDLANSDIETVNGLWKGLGYYSRAARLLAGAQKVVKEYNGIFPTSAKDMIANIPGIGRYSAGAISSIAYNHCEPVLDGNVNRLLSRVLRVHANPKSKAALDILWDGAIAAVRKSDRPGDINQALIELGSTVCKPRDPSCSSCPLSTHCGAYLESQGRSPPEQDIEELCTICEPVLSDEEAGVTRYPMKVERKKAREETDVVNVVEWLSSDDERFFILVRRPETGLLAGLHEFPSRADVKDAADSPDGLRTIGQETLRELLVVPPSDYQSPSSPAKSSAQTHSNLRMSKMKPAGDVLHVFSHIRKTYRVQWILLEGGQDLPELNPTYAAPDHSSAETGKKGKAKSKSKKSEPLESGEGGKRSPEMKPSLRWVRYEDVEAANIGTGVLKVWKKVNDLWTD